MRQAIGKWWTVIEHKLFGIFSDALINRCLEGAVLVPVIQDLALEVWKIR